MKTKQKPKEPVSPELAALHKTYDALAALDAEQRRRVMSALMDLLGLNRSF